jgi:hypothetical protein
VRPLRVALAQFEGATTMRVLPLAAGPLAAATFPDVADLLRDAIAWDTLSLPERFAATKTERFRWDWLAYVANMGACSRPVPRAISVRRLPQSWANSSSASAHLDTFLTLGWSKMDRVHLAYFEVNIAAFDVSDPSAAFFTKTAV